MAISRKQAEDEVAKFNTFYDAAPEHVKTHYSQRSDINSYERCFQCGTGYLDMRAFRAGDLPANRAVTVQPIIGVGL